jgi:hypothetical protein
MMKEKITKHFWYYLTFLCVELSGVFAVYYFAYDTFIRMVFIILMGLFYVVWSSLHHHLHHTLTKKIMIEYVLIGIFGVVVILFFLQ